MYSVNQRLAVRGAIFTLEVLIGGTGPAVKTAPKTNKFESLPPPVYDTSKEIQGVSTVQSKYFSKISKKLGGANPMAGSNPSSKGDSELHSAAKQLLQQESQRAGKVQETSRWLLQEGMGGVLEYSNSRTIGLAVLALNSHSDDLLKAFQSQTDDIPWMFVGKSSGGVSLDATLFATKAEEDLTLAEKKFSQSGGITPGQIVFVSSNETCLKIAKERGMLTCRFRPADGLFGQVSTDYLASSSIELQDCLEELNGIALRASAYGSRAF